MDTIILLLYLALGGAIGIAMAFLFSRRRNQESSDGLVSGCVAGAFGAAILHLLATSVWVDQAVASRMPGIADSWGVGVAYLLWIHPVLGAIAGALALFLMWKLLRTATSL
jgi:uncharacterized membrane protein YeaQ/YmgE (transglycosylase-associated protein family)